MGSSNTLEIIIKANDQASRTLSGISDKASSSLTSLGKNMMKTGAVMTAASAPFAAALVSSIQSASQFETSMTNVQAVLGKTDAEMVGINKAVLAMGAASTVGPQAAADAYYDIVGGVADASTHMAILDAAIKTSEAGAADLGATTSALISTMNAYGYSADQASMVSDILTQTVSKGVGTMDEFAAAMPKVATMAATVDEDFGNVGAAMAYLTTKGYTANESATKLTAAYTALLKPNEELLKGLKAMGVESGSAALEQWGLAGTLGRLEQAYGGNVDAMAAALGSTEALQAAMALNEAGYEDFLTTFLDTSEGVTDAARKVQLDSLSSQTKLLKSNFDALKITIGMALIPVITKLVSAVTPILKSIIGWAQENPKLVKTIAAIVVGVGGLGLALTAIGGVLAAVGGGFAMLLGPVGAVIAIFAAFGAAYATNFLGFRDFVQNLIGDIGRLAEQIKSAFASEGLAGVGKLLLDKIAGGIGDLVGWVTEKIVTPISNAITNTDWAAVPGQIEAILDKIAATALDFGTWVWDKIGSPIVEAIKGVDWAGVGNVLWDIVTAIGAYTLEFGMWVWNHIASPVIEALKAVDWAGAGDALIDIVNTIGNAAWDAASWIWAHIASPVIEALKGVDWAGVGNVLWDIVTAIGGYALEFGMWVWNNIASPIVDALAAVDWAGVGDTIYTILNKMGAAVWDGASWVWEHLGRPLVDALVAVDWSGVGDTLLNIITKVGEAVVDFATWVWDNIASPLIDAVLAVDWSSVKDTATSLLSSIANGLLEIGTWVFDNLVTPVVNALIGADWSGILSTGLSILGKIVEGMGDLVTWVTTNLITPLVNSLITADWSGVLQTGVNIISKVAEGIGDLTIWVTDNIITPASNALVDGATTLYNSAIDLGGNILNGILDSLSSLASELIQIINDAIPNKVDFGTIHVPDLGPFGGGYDKHLSLDIPDNPIPGGKAGGGPVRANVPYFVGERGMELFVPRTSGTIVPNDALRGGSGGGGGRTYNMQGAQFVLPGVSNVREFFDELEREARRRNRNLSTEKVGAWR